MAKPNYQFEKRQRELEKKKKKEEKLQQRRSGASDSTQAGAEQVENASPEPSAGSGNDTGAAPQAEASA